jgi:hypothetical protein
LSRVWKRNNGYGKTIDAGAIVEIGFAQEPQELNNGSGKTNYPGTIHRGFTVYTPLLYVLYYWHIITHCYIDPF